MGDQGIGRIQNDAGGAVVLLQPDHLQIGIIALQLGHVLDLGAAPGIDRLIVIADAEDDALLARHQSQPAVLQRVGVLELVHQDVPEALVVVRPQISVVAQQLEGAQQQLGEIHQAVVVAGALIGAVGAHQCALRDIAAVAEVLRAQCILLLLVDPAGHGLRWPAVLGHVQAAQHALDLTHLVIGIQNLEILDQAGVLPVQPQHAVGNAVEGSHPQRTHGDVQQCLDAPAHFGGGLVGEGHREDGVR